MPNTPSTLPALFAALRTALEADAAAARTRLSGTVEALFLAFLLQLVARLEAHAGTWSDATPHHAARHPASLGEGDRLPFHLRLRDARRARILSRGSRGRRRIPTWWARNRGARAIPGRTRIPARTIAARAPPPNRRA